MTDRNPNRERTDRTESQSPRYDNWPIEGSEEDVRYLGFTGGTGDSGSPMLYQETDATVYEGSIDEENERIVLSEQSAREFDDETTIADVVETIADEVGWKSLSEWAEEKGSGGEDVDRVEFDRRDVRESVEYDYGFRGSYTYSDGSGRKHIVDRTFQVYTDSDRRDDAPLVVLEETHLVAENPQEERRAGDAEEVGRRTLELAPDIDTEYEASSVHEWCRDWHESHLDVPPE